jgi:Fe-S cluster assembly protein SufD
MKAYEAAFARLPEPRRRTRARHLQAFLDRGFPDKSLEDWRYTDLSALAAQSFEPAAAQPVPACDLEGSETLAFVNGEFVRGDRALLGGTEFPDAADGVTALNAAFATGGAHLEIAAGVRRKPLHLDTWFGGAAQRMAHLRHHIHLGANAQATVVLHERGDDAAFFATQVFDIELAPGAQLDLQRVQHHGAGTTAVTRMDVRLAADSRFDCSGIYAGGALVRNDINVVLARGAQARVAGVLAPSRSEHLDVHTRIDHRGTHAVSREIFRTIVQDRARAVFNGKVIVHPGAQKTDSEQHVDSLLLSPQAEVNAKPELEIYADDVKCAHGATCGQIDEAQVFYLRSRGLALEAARNLLLFTFAHSVLKQMSFEPARRLAEQTLLARLPGAPKLDELSLLPPRAGEGQDGGE